MFVIVLILAIGLVGFVYYKKQKASTIKQIPPMQTFSPHIKTKQTSVALVTGFPAELVLDSGAIAQASILERDSGKMITYFYSGNKPEVECQKYADYFLSNKFDMTKMINANHSVIYAANQKYTATVTCDIATPSAMDSNFTVEVQMK